MDFHGDFQFPEIALRFVSDGGEMSVCAGDAAEVGESAECAERAQAHVCGGGFPQDDERAEVDVTGDDGKDTTGADGA